MAVLTVPKILREKLTEEGAEALIVLLDAVESHAHDVTLETVEEKFERRLTEVKTSLEMKIGEVKSDLEVKIAEVKSELIKWMFLFWIGQSAVVFAIVKLVR